MNFRKLFKIGLGLTTISALGLIGSFYVVVSTWGRQGYPFFVVFTCIFGIVGPLTLMVWFFKLLGPAEALEIVHLTDENSKSQ